MMDIRRARPAWVPVAVLVLGIAAGLVGLTAVHALRQTAAGPPATPASAAVPPAPTGQVPARPAADKHIQPTALKIPAIGVATGLVDLGLNPDRTLQVPSDFGEAGWYAGGSAPGDAGAPAVIAGHVDSYTGPAIFYRLHQLIAGSDILVTGIDGKTRHFKVYRTVQYDKSSFPAGQVYASTTRPELRLITCSGDFDSNTRSYLSNLVVYAQLVAG